MTDPYRDRHLACPACKATLRPFRTRQVCDACGGMLIAPDDLAGAIHDLTSITPAFEYRDEAAGKRGCPACGQAMATCKLRVMLDEEIEQPRPELDRCAEHGIWFDGEELAKVFEKVASKGYGGGVGRKGSPGGRGGTLPSGGGGVWEWRGSLGTKK